LKRYYGKINVVYQKFHTYRHTFATTLSKAGIPIQVTADLLGHDSIEVTAKYYIDISEEEKIRAIETIQISPLIAAND
jgi:integrase